MNAPAIKSTSLLDCGHTPTPTEGLGTGYGMRADDTTLCYDCANREARENMIVEDVVHAYLSDDGKSITTWPGGTLARVTEHGTAAVGWHGSTLHYIRAKGPDGSEWYGRNGGPGMFITLRRAKVNR